MSDTEDHQTPSDSETPEAAEASEGNAPPAQAQDELLAAMNHFKNAAGILLGKAVNEGTIERVTSEAEQALGQFTATAEPFARQLTTELAKVGKLMGQTLTEAIQAQTQPLHQEATEDSHEEVALHSAADEEAEPQRETADMTSDGAHDVEETARETDDESGTH